MMHPFSKLENLWTNDEVISDVELDVLYSMMDTDEVEGVKFLEFPKKLGLKMKKEKKKEFRIFII